MVFRFICVCNGTGFEGTVCSTDVNECTRELHECQNDGACVNQIGNYTCTCRTGYTGITCVVDALLCCNRHYRGILVNPIVPLMLGMNRF